MNASPRSAQSLCPFCSKSPRCRKMLAHCLCPRTKKYHSTPSPSTHLGGTSLGRQVIRARCLQPGRTTMASSNVYFGCRTQLLLLYPSDSFCFTIAGVGHRQRGASGGWDSIIRPSQVLRWVPLPRFFRPWQFKLWSRAYSETATTKDLSWLLNPNQF